MAEGAGAGAEHAAGARGRARRFGRARRLTMRRRVMEIVYELAYRGGWPSRLARPLGLQGTLRVTTHALALPARTDAAAPVLRVAFAADLHAGPATHPELVAQACRALADARPDLLLLGGDFVSFHARHADALVPLLAAIEAPLGKLAVLGNHDLMADDAYIVARLAEAGVRTLVNEAVRLPAPHADVWVCGLDDPGEGRPDARAALAGADGTRLVLVHSPEGARALEGHDHAMVFCGHVHGGQFWLGERTLTSYSGALNRRYLRGGVFPPAEGRMGTLVVSRGVGQSSLPLRRRADPEVHVLALERPRA